MATTGTQYDDMNIDWARVKAGDEDETQRAMKSVERLCHLVGVPTDGMRKTSSKKCG